MINVYIKLIFRHEMKRKSKSIKETNKKPETISTYDSSQLDYSRTFIKYCLRDKVEQLHPCNGSRAVLVVPYFISS